MSRCTIYKSLEFAVQDDIFKRPTFELTGPPLRGGGWARMKWRPGRRHAVVGPVERRVRRWLLTLVMPALGKRVIARMRSLLEPRLHRTR